jgi:hypothetical protein
MAGHFPDVGAMASIPKTGGRSKTSPTRRSRARAVVDQPERPLADDHLLYLLFELERIVMRSKIKWSPELASGVEGRLESLIQTIRRTKKW